ncbi:AsmA-like C-terminal region-containing protein [Coraliomargarita parva]|uniref:AsmA-like C-terminal region-containing protein n=1 Tax=Coraliomargarita parva TaxID=3014050 RepID=UPI0022B49E96|nr:AsmA-like C-terminal region-containing protein [Coraliomargarita parva]
MSKRRKLKWAGLLELLFDSGLLVLFVAQAFIAGCLLTYGYIPLPKEKLNREVSGKLPPGLRVEADSYRLNMSGKIELAGLKILSEDSSLPLFESDGIVVDIALGEGHMLKPELVDISIANGTLYLPAVYSPDGKRITALERISMRISRSDTNYVIENIAAMHENVRLRGSIEWPSDRIPQKAVTGPGQPKGHALRSFYKFIARAALAKDQLDFLTRPTVAFQLRPGEDGAVQALVNVSSRKLEHARTVGEDLRIRTELSISEDNILSQTQIKVFARTLQLPDYQTEIHGLTAYLRQEAWESFRQGLIPEFSLAAEDLVAYGIPIESPVVSVDLKAFPLVKLEGTTRGLKGAAKVRADINLLEQSGTIQADGSLDLLPLLPDKIRTALPSIRIDRKPDYQLRVNLASGWSLERAQLKARVNAIRVAELAFDYIGAELSLEDGQIQLDHTYLRRGRQWLDLGVGFNLDSKDYGISLVGFGNPKDYSPILPRWWKAIFRDFEFSRQSAGIGDFIIYGNGQNKVADLYYGSAVASSVTFRDVLLEEGSLVVRGRGRYAEVHDLDVRNKGGWIKGDVTFTSRADAIRAPVSVRLDLDAKIALEDAAKLFGGNISGLIREFESETSPRATLNAAIFNTSAYPAYAGRSYFDLAVSSPQPIRFKDVPFDRLALDVHGRDDMVHLRNVEFGYADGNGTAEADILLADKAKPELRFVFNLEDADETQAIRDLPQLKGVESSLDTMKGENIDRNQREKTRLNLDLHARGPLDDLYQYDGFGSFTIQGDRIGNIDLLGPLSRALNKVHLSFTSFTLDRMAGDFRLRNNRIRFNPLLVTGPRTRVEGKGTVLLPKQELDMELSVSLFSNFGRPDTTIGKISDRLNPLPTLLKFELTGTIQDQQLRSVYDPRNLIPGL